MPRKRTVTAKRTTAVTEQVTVTEETTPTSVIAWAPGWHTPPDRNTYRAQRSAQVRRCVDFLALWAISSPADATAPERLVPDAAIILRAGPGATPLEATLGRSI